MNSMLAEAAPAIPDEEIVRRVIEGETSLFELLIRRHNQRLFRAVRSILRDEAEAEDAMQEAYVRAFVHLDQYAGDAKFSTWLTKIAVYEALGRIRRRKHMQDMPENLSDTSNPERSTYDQELKGAIESAVDALPDLYRAVFMLREVEGMNVAETAACLGISEETVKTRLHRARRLLRDRLEKAIGSAVGQTFTFGARRCDRITAATMRRIQEITR